MSNSSYIDINGIYDTQKNFLDQIRDNPRIDPNQVDEIQNKIQTSYNTLGNAQVTAGNIYTEQTKMLNIVNSEADRLEKKKHTIDSALDGQKRMISLNDSYRLRNNDYSNILVYTVVSISILVILAIIRRNFPIIPSLIIDILYVIIISYTLYICYTKYLVIESRDKLYYNELNLSSPKMSTPEQIAKQNADAQQKAKNSPAANLLSTINIDGCAGPLCCSGDSYWDPTNSICTTGNLKVAGFTTLHLAYGNGEFLLKPKITDSILPNSPSEFDRYGKI